MARIYQGQTNLKLIVDCKNDISSATTLRIYYEKPDGTDGYVTATIVSGSTTKMEYTFTGSSFVDQEGRYKVRAYTDGTDGEVYGDWDSFYVYPNAVAP